jgi:hypothetical protein
MITVVIKDNGEPKVIQLTYENLWRELKDVDGAELLVLDNWFEALDDIDNKYICFVEADCLVNSGYFTSQVGLFKKNPYFRKLAMLGSAVGVNQWFNKFYGYSVTDGHTDKLVPIRDKKSGSVYPVQVSYFPGSVVRVSMLKTLLGTLDDKTLANLQTDLVSLSTIMSLGFWRQGDGNRVHINPNATYVTTENYVNDLGQSKVEAKDLAEKFEMESI